MPQQRARRFVRASTIAPIRLTKRDLDIIRLVHRHRFLRSTHITSLILGSKQQILRRLQLLYHHGYLERPRQQIEYFHRGGSHAMVYGITDKGAALLTQERTEAASKPRWSDKNRYIGRTYLEHALFVSDFMVALEIACLNSGNVRLLSETELAPSTGVFKWKVKTNAGQKLSVIPDRVFGLEYENVSGQKNRAFFFLEADRGTMPVVRKRLSQTSFFRKLLAYEATWTQSIHTKRFGFDRFRVVTITTSPKRIQSLVDGCAQLERGQGLFLFGDRGLMEKPESLLVSLWQTGRKGQTSTLLD